MRLRKTEIAGLKTVGEEDIQKGDDGIDLRIRVGSIGVIEAEAQ